MDEWPLHITVADVFAIPRKRSAIDDKLKDLLRSTVPVTTTASRDTILGTTNVILLDQTPALSKLHLDLITLLTANGANFNSPEYNIAGFLPHCTIQLNERLYPDDEITIDSLSLVDLYPEQNWRQRRVLQTFSLQNPTQE